MEIVYIQSMEVSSRIECIVTTSTRIDGLSLTKYPVEIIAENKYIGFMVSDSNYTLNT